MKTHSLVVMLLLVMMAGSAHAGETGPAPPSKSDKCPVCGMFVYKYPDWVGQIIFRDGAIVYFDGAKDLLLYYFNLETYAPARARADIAAIYVTEYYSMQLIDVQEAFFVIGSDVHGPMGRELIPLLTRADAEAFRKDHKGQSILRFEQLTPAIVHKLNE